MKTLASQRVRPLLSLTHTGTQKKRRLSPVDIRRWKALRAWWDSQVSCGMDLNLSRIGRKKGHPDGNMASQILNGHAAMNLQWMLYFAQEMGSVPPQRVWKEDWPFPDLTPDYMDRDLCSVTRRWASLSATTRRKLVALAQGQHPR